MAEENETRDRQRDGRTDRQVDSRREGKVVLELKALDSIHLWIRNDTSARQDPWIQNERSKGSLRFALLGFNCINTVAIEA